MVILGEFDIEVVDYYNVFDWSKVRNMHINHDLNVVEFIIMYLTGDYYND